MRPAYIFLWARYLTSPLWGGRKIRSAAKDFSGGALSPAPLPPPEARSALRPPHKGEVISERLLEMEARDREFEAVIEAVRAQAVGAGIQVELGAAFGARQIFHPAHQRLGEALAAVAFQADQVVDIKRLAPGQPF